MSLAIVIPTVGRPTLKEAVHSVRTQTRPTGCVVIKDYKHEGAGPTRNRGVKKVTTDWVGFCDDDDWLDPHYHEWLNEYPDADVVLFQMQRPDGMILPSHTDSSMLAYNWMGISFALRTDVAKRYPFKNMIGEDFELIRQVQRAGLRLVVDSRVAYYLGSEVTL